MSIRDSAVSEPHLLAGTGDPAAADSVEARAAGFLALRDSGNWSNTDEELLRSWIDQSTAHRIAYLRLDEIWTRADRLAALRRPRGSRRIESQLHAEWRSGRWRRGAWGSLTSRVGIGAALVGLGGVLAVFSLGPWDGLRFETDVGGREVVSLVDGSRLTLNTDSRVRAVLREGTRTVWLERGEVYFDVAHDRARPFVVLSGHDRITVLGTRFSVRNENDHILVLVEEGRVQVEAIGDGKVPLKGAVVARDDAVVADARDLTVTHRTPDQLRGALRWREGKVVLDQLTLAEAAAEFNRYNQRKLVIADESISKIRIGGTFDAGNVAHFAQLLRTGFGLTVRENTDEIIVSR